VITVIIPTRDRACLVAEAIASVLHSPLVSSADQIILVDDDSSDHTVDVARDLGVRYLRVSSHNSGAARNAGLAVATTPFVTFLDDDDVWLPGNMEPQLAALEARPDAGFAYGIVRCATQALEPLPHHYPSPPLSSGAVPERLHLAYPQLGVVLFRRHAIEAVGGFDARIPYHQDGDLMLRVAAQHEIVGVEVVGMLHRLRPPSRGRSDYHWRYRDTATWRPRHIGLGWKCHTAYIIGRKSHFFHRFAEDGAACAAAGERRNALVCVGRALWMSPPHALRHSRLLASIVAACVST
jgi:glycosyltransferase involved in cell wall biosynthesis